MDSIIRLLSSIISLFAITRKGRRAVRFAIRSRWYGRMAYGKAKVGKGCLFRGYATVNKNTVIGDSVFIGELEISGMGAVEIGNYTQIAPECLILTSNNKYKNSDELPFGSDMDIRSVKIGRCAWIGQRVTILPGTEIGEGSIIQAGSVVRGKIPPLSIVGGNPAKIFAQRDAIHYARLAEAGKFHTKLFA